MAIFEMLDVAIGMIFIYLLLSVICSAVREGIESWLKTRAAFLEQGIRLLLNDVTGKGLVEQFYKHPLVSSLYSATYKPAERLGKPNSVFARGSELPSYIPSSTFARALMDLAARGPEQTALNSGGSARLLSLDTLRANVASLQNVAVQRALLTAIDTAQGDLEKVQANIESWYDSAMDRVSGWYRRATQWIIFWLALSVAVVMNVDSIRVANHLYRDGAVRAALVERARAAAANAAPPKDYETATAAIEQFALPIGWNNPAVPPLEMPRDAKGLYNVVLLVAGWLITALAATLGAPFWFDVLNKVMVIRSTVKPFEKSPPEASEDRQRSGTPAVHVTAGRAAGIPRQANAAAALPDDDPEQDVDATNIDLQKTELTADAQLPRPR